MIPKKIHYCWFGGNPFPPLVEECLKSWQEILPEYEFVRWDESNFDVGINHYVKQAYDAKKYAFVADYVRLYAIYNYGGIYMDTDVEVLQKLDSFLHNQAFSGFESYTSVPTGIMAGIKHFQGYKDLLNYYNDKSFLNEDGSYNLKTNVEIITEIYCGKGLRRDNTLQTIDGFTFYPKMFFCPLKLDIDSTNISDIYTIHHFAGSWLSEEEIKRRNSFSYKLKSKIIKILRRFFIFLVGRKNFEVLRGRKNNTKEN